MSGTGEKVAFIGLGVMGFPMAGHLAAKDHRVTVYNRTAARAAAWGTQHGGATAATPAKAAAELGRAEESGKQRPAHRRRLGRRMADPQPLAVEPGTLALQRRRGPQGDRVVNPTGAHFAVLDQRDHDGEEWSA